MSFSRNATGTVASRRWRFAALLVGMALIVAACGGGEAETTEGAQAETGSPTGGTEAESPAGETGTGPARGAPTIDEPIDLRVAGGSPGSSVQVSGTGIADLLDQHAETVSSATVTSSDGAIANLRLVEQGQAQLGHSVTTGMYDSLNSLGAFEGEEPYTNWRAIAPGYTVPLYIVTTDDSGIQSVPDVEGRRLAMGPRGAGTSAAWTQVLDALEIEADRQYMPFDEGNARLADGTVAAHMLGVQGIGAAIDAEATLRDATAWVGITDQEIQDAILEAIPPMSRMPLQEEPFDTLEEDIETVGYLAVLIAHQDTPDAVVYETLSLIMERGREFLEPYGQFWVQAFELDLLPGFEALESIGATLHPGAVQFWQDQGEDVPDAIIPSG